MANKISKLHYITQDIEGKSPAEQAEQACRGGVNWVQLRMKNAQEEKWLDEAIKTLIVCRKYGAQLIINDNPALAVEIGADGVHLGKGDMDLSEARAMIGNEMLLGATANSFEDVVEASKHDIDYLGIGPFRFTPTKKVLSPVLGLKGFEEIVKAMINRDITIPVIAIGGVLIEDISSVLSCGVHGVAIASGINLAENPTQTASFFVKKLG